MKGLVLTHIGFEDIAAKEVKELVKATDIAINNNGTIIFDVKDFKDLCLLAYRSQSAVRVLQLFGEFEVSKDLDAAISNIKKVIDDNKKEIDSYIKDGFTVSCTRIGEHDFTSQDLMLSINGLIDKSKINLKNPKTIFFIYISGSSGYFGPDLAGFDLSKRDYKIYNPSRSIKGSFAYCMLRLAGYNKKKVFLDPFVYSGVFPVEAALFASGKSPNYYRKDKFLFNNIATINFDNIDSKISDAKLQLFAFSDSMNSLRAAKNNAKIAGVNKLISFSKLDVEWLDTKFGKSSIDCIATKPPFITKRSEPSEVKKVYNEFFHQAEFIMKRDGRIVMLANSEEPLATIAANGNFKLKEKRGVLLGKEPMLVLVFTK